MFRIDSRGSEGSQGFAACLNEIIVTVQVGLHTLLCRP